MDFSDYTCLFLPGIPGPKKEYLFLEDVVTAGFAMKWLTYSGTYERKSEAPFSLDQSVIDITSEISRLEARGKPYFIIAYSYSTYVLRFIDPSLYPRCAAILMFSPILSLDTEDIGEPFNGLIDYLVSSGDMNAKSWHNDGVARNNKILSLSKWLHTQEAARIPTFLLMGDDDLSGMAREDLCEFESSREEEEIWPIVHLQSYAGAAHKLDSYYKTSARSFIWSVMAVIRLKSILGTNFTYLLWGSLVNSSTWTYFSDIDILILGNLEVTDYKLIAKVKYDFEKCSGIHFGISINRTADLQRNTFIRQNRAAIFLHELKYAAICFGNPPHIRPISKSELATDATTTIAILRAQISKDLLAYYMKPEQTTKRIVKAFLQAVRLTQYASGEDIAVIRPSDLSSEMKTLVDEATRLKEINYKDSRFEPLYAMSIAADSLSPN